LPVRDIADDAGCDSTSTALRCKFPEKEGVPDPYLSEVTYGKLAGLGATDPKDEGFQWLWRSEIEDYDRLSRTLQRWISRLFLWTVEYRKRHSDYWHGGFRAYDELTCKRFCEVDTYESFVEFGRLCDVLVSKLNAAAREPESDE
jgi:hypothetical protein